MKKGMEENGQRTDPGTDGRQEQEDAVLRGQLQQALDSVEPDGEARERMLRRIREKAAARQTADEPTSVRRPELAAHSRHAAARASGGSFCGTGFRPPPACAS